MRAFRFLSVFGRKGTDMYIPYKLADGFVVLVELKPDVAEFILKNDREIANADRKERDHVKYHLEALEYEGMEYADPNTPEDILIRQEEKEQLDDMLSCLTDTQLQRLTMKAEGMTLRQIAEAEGTNVNAVRDSLLQVRKKLEKYRDEF